MVASANQLHIDITADCTSAVDAFDATKSAARSLNGETASVSIEVKGAGDANRAMDAVRQSRENAGGSVVIPFSTQGAEDANRQIAEQRRSVQGLIGDLAPLARQRHGVQIDTNAVRAASADVAEFSAGAARSRHETAALGAVVRALSSEHDGLSRSARSAEGSARSLASSHGELERGLNSSATAFSRLGAVGERALSGIGAAGGDVEAGAGGVSVMVRQLENLSSAARSTRSTLGSVVTGAQMWSPFGGSGTLPPLPPGAPSLSPSGGFGFQSGAPGGPPPTIPPSGGRGGSGGSGGAGRGGSGSNINAGGLMLPAMAAAIGVVEPLAAAAVGFLAFDRVVKDSPALTAAATQSLAAFDNGVRVASQDAAQVGVPAFQRLNAAVEPLGEAVGKVGAENLGGILAGVSDVAGHATSMINTLAGSVPGAITGATKLGDALIDGVGSPQVSHAIDAVSAKLRDPDVESGVRTLTTGALSLGGVAASGVGDILGTVSRITGGSADSPRAQSDAMAALGGGFLGRSLLGGPAGALGGALLTAYANDEQAQGRDGSSALVSGYMGGMAMQQLTANLGPRAQAAGTLVGMGGGALLDKGARAADSYLDQHPPGDMTGWGHILDDSLKGAESGAVLGGMIGGPVGALVGGTIGGLGTGLAEAWQFNPHADHPAGAPGTPGGPIAPESQTGAPGSRLPTPKIDQGFFDGAPAGAADLTKIDDNGNMIHGTRGDDGSMSFENKYASGDSGVYNYDAKSGTSQLGGHSLTDAYGGFSDAIITQAKSGAQFEQSQSYSGITGKSSSDTVSRKPNQPPPPDSPKGGIGSKGADSQGIGSQFGPVADPILNGNEENVFDPVDNPNALSVSENAAVGRGPASSRGASQTSQQIGAPGEEQGHAATGLNLALANLDYGPDPTGFATGNSLQPGAVSDLAWLGPSITSIGLAPGFGWGKHHEAPPGYNPAIGAKLAEIDHGLAVGKEPSAAQISALSAMLGVNNQANASRSTATAPGAQGRSQASAPGIAAGVPGAQHDVANSAMSSVQGHGLAAQSAITGVTSALAAQAPAMNNATAATNSYSAAQSHSSASTHQSMADMHEMAQVESEMNQSAQANNASMQASAVGANTLAQGVQGASAAVGTLGAGLGTAQSVTDATAASLGSLGSLGANTVGSMASVASGLGGFGPSFGASASAGINSAMHDAGVDAGNSHAEGLASTTGANTDAGAGVGAAGPGGAASSDGSDSHSPSRKMFQIGVWGGEGMRLGLLSMLSSVTESGANLGHTPVTSAATAAATAMDQYNMTLAGGFGAGLIAASNGVTPIAQDYGLMLGYSWARNVATGAQAVFQSSQFEALTTPSFGSKLAQRNLGLLGLLPAAGSGAEYYSTTSGNAGQVTMQVTTNPTINVSVDGTPLRVMAQQVVNNSMNSLVDSINAQSG